MRDAREAGVAARLADVADLVAVGGGKGGIGKTLVASALALALARRGRRVGLLDLDLTSPCTHLVLGYPTGFPEEPFGIVPPLHAGVRSMSIAHFASATPAPLRGEDVTNALVELLAITNWGALDILVVDMPPGIGDAALDAVRLLPRARFLSVATPSRVVVETVRRTLRLLGDLGRDRVGVVENMQRESGDTVRALARSCDVPYLGALPYDPTVEEATGDVEKLSSTPLFRALDALVPQITAGGDS